MPMHDWTRVNAGIYRDFHEDWIVELRRQLNGGILPPGYYARADQRVDGPEPDIVAYHQGKAEPVSTTVLDRPPRARLKATIESKSEAAHYARKANRLTIRKDRGRVVAVIEIVSPGNKTSQHELRSFVQKAVRFLQNGIHLLVIDPFPPTRRDPEGLHQAIWDELVEESFEARPADKPLTVAAYDVDEMLTSYVEPFAVGDAVPEMPLFIEPGQYVLAPLETSYQASWAVLPEITRNQVLASPST